MGNVKSGIALLAGLFLFAGTAAAQSEAPLPRLEEFLFKKPVPMSSQNKAPYYPRIARQNGYEGIVFLRLLVDERGEVANTELLRSSGHRILDQEAVKTVRAWRFVPAEQMGECVASHAEVPVVFRLGDGGSAPAEES
ncbi:MAG: energy transducer TonB [Candidatus Omnitrophota bacterium]|jgi:protein TonB